MKWTPFIVFFTLLFSVLSACGSEVNRDKETAFNDSLPRFQVTIDTLVDSSRNRMIPVAHFIPEKSEVKGWVIFSHGYGANQPETFLKYQYLTTHLAEEGYWVTSIQHELTGDPILPIAGNMQVLRLPFWQRGAENIAFVYQEGVQKNSHLISKPLILIGHSNGGDMSAYFSTIHPQQVHTLITLDNWRRSLTLAECKRLLTIRASDSRTDNAVFEHWEKRKTQYASVEQLSVKHADMSDRGTEDEKKQILRLIAVFLQAD